MLQVDICKEKKIGITTKITQCGPQPKFDDWLGIQYQKLVPFQYCYWTVKYVNFNGEFYNYHTGSWERTKSNLNIKTVTMIKSFPQIEDDSYYYDSQKNNPANHQNQPNHADIVADIIAVMNERYYQ